MPAGDGDGDAPFASAEDVILLELMRDSDQDRADVRAILAAQPIDRVYLRAWARRLRLLARLRRYLG